MLPVRHRLRHLLLNLVVFNGLYLLCNAVAQQAGVQRHWVLPWDAHVAFLPWMVIPYLSSGLFFCLGFFWVHSVDQLRLLSQRLLLATVLAAFVFMAYPLQFSWVRPPISVPLLSVLFDFLSVVDRPYNQLPSLHVAYCLIVWFSLRRAIASPWAKAAVGAWLLLTAVSTVFTYQHHIIDVFGGLLLGTLCLQLIKPGRAEPAVAFYYLLASAVVLLVLVLVGQQVWGLYVVISLLLVAWAYARQDRFFLRKANGRFSATTWLLYAPYLLGYWLTWQAVRWRERHQPPLRQVTGQLWIGRRLSAAEAHLLPANCFTLDLSNELSEDQALRAGGYLHVPLLDLLSPPEAARQVIVSTLSAEIAAGRVVYLHCSMGYSRCKQLADAFVEQHSP